MDNSLSPKRLSADCLRESDEDSLNPTRLSTKRSRGSDEDMISNLPDSLLQHILCFVTIRDAIKTSALSHRWQNVWTFIPCLKLDSGEFSDDEDFLNFMDRFLDLRGNSYLQTFILRTVTPVYLSSRLEAWISAAVMCKVKHLEVEHQDVELGFHSNVIPRCLCVCHTLVVLKLDTADLDIPELVSLPSLKIMHLDEVMFMGAADLAFKRLILGCPVLEELSITRSIFEDNLKVLSIFSQTLKRLKVDVRNLYEVEGHGMVIDAPHLEDLKLRDLVSENFVIRNLSSFKAKVDVNFNVPRGKDSTAAVSRKRTSIRGFLCGISNVKSLTISLTTLQILSQYTRMESLPKFHNLFHLEARLEEEKEWEVLPAFLESSPNLKSFIMDYLPVLGPAPDSNPFRLSLSTPQCMLSSLESVTLRKLIIGDPTEIDLVKYFLEKSAYLKEMKVYFCEDLPREEMSFIAVELLTFPRRSTACEIYF